MHARRIVLYAVGSSLVVDAEEACARAGITIVAGVRNVDGPTFTSEALRVLTPAEIDADVRTCECVCALFTPGLRKAAVEDARANGLRHGAVLVDPTSAVARSATLAEGVFVNAGCVIAGAARLGRWVLVNRSASVGHHVHIDDYASIGPGAVLCGHVSVGRGAMIGAGSVILPNVSVGANAIVGAGSLVLDPVPAHARCEGRPAVVVDGAVEGYRGLAV